MQIVTESGQYYQCNKEFSINQLITVVEDCFEVIDKLGRKSCNLVDGDRIIIDGNLTGATCFCSPVCMVKYYK